MNVEIDSNSDLVIGADIGGSNIRVALVAVSYTHLTLPTKA